MKRTISSLLVAALALGMAILAGCANPGSAPTATQAMQIQSACAVDAAVRPTVTALMAIPGLATIQEGAAIVAARAVIDPICANPAAPVQANALTALSAASGQVVAIVAQLQARKAASGAPAPAAAAASPGGGK